MDTPRHAAVLLVVGDLPPSLEEVLATVHDELPAPRATLWWRPGDGDGGATVESVWRALLERSLASEPDWLPDSDPAPWRGIGPYGQGGTGMTGGVPFGRPMAGRAPDRDRLELDQLTARVGPLFPALPTGLVLDVQLQGDVVQAVTVVAPTAWPASDAAATAGMSLAALETARARHHLRWLADALRIAGRGALGLRALAAAEAPTLDAPSVARLRRAVVRDPALWAAGRGVGITSAPGLGPVSRAAGLADDARIADAAYRALGFEPVVHRAGDVRARWLQRLEETLQAIDLADRAGVATVDAATVEGPRGRVGSNHDARLLALLPQMLTGLEWGDAIATITSLDVEPVAAPVPVA